MKKLTLIIATLFILSCSKEKTPVAEPTHEVKIFCYSETADFTISYRDVDGAHEKQIALKQYQMYIIVSDYTSTITLRNTKTATTDSLYIRAESEGKKVEDGYRFNGGMSNIWVQLSQLK